MTRRQRKIRNRAVFVLVLILAVGGGYLYFGRTEPYSVKNYEALPLVTSPGGEVEKTVKETFTTSTLYDPFEMYTFTSPAGEVYIINGMTQSWKRKETVDTRAVQAYIHFILEKAPELFAMSDLSMKVRHGAHFIIINDNQVEINGEAIDGITTTNEDETQVISFINRYDTLGQPEWMAATEVCHNFIAAVGIRNLSPQDSARSEQICGSVSFFHDQLARGEKPACPRIGYWETANKRGKTPCLSRITNFGVPAAPLFRE